MGQRKLVVITGATRGLGRAMVDEFIRRGHTIAGCGRSLPDLDALKRAHPPPHRFDRVDVADDLQVRDWAACVIEACGVPDLMLNNAALINRNAPLWEVPADEFSAVIDVNLKGVASVIRHFAPPMMARGRGMIVNFSSGWGRETDPRVAPYCASKWAVEGLTRSLAQELPRGMAAVALNPGIIDTDMLHICFGEAAAQYPPAQVWARSAVPYLLSLGPEHNGRPLTMEPA
jgi:NAD(P)-dependent dehydrogenase (short-subunit alcohol dehydrogenase family)